MKNALEVKYEQLKVKLEECKNLTFPNFIGREANKIEKYCFDEIQKQILGQSEEARISFLIFEKEELEVLPKLFKYLEIKGYSVELYSEIFVTIKVSEPFLDLVRRYNDLRRVL